MPPSQSSFFFFFNDTATTEIYTLSLHDALPILRPEQQGFAVCPLGVGEAGLACRAVGHGLAQRDRKSTRLNSSHSQISYAVFCLKKKKNTEHANHVEQSRSTPKLSAARYLPASL